MKSFVLIVALCFLAGLVAYQFRKPVEESPLLVVTETSFDFKIEGMTCDHCAQSISAVLEKNFMAEDIEISVKSGDISFKVKGDVKEDSIQKAIESLGYKVLESKNNLTDK